jgi:hypothetical protein
VCVLSCLFMLANKEKHFPHWKHWKGFSPVCILSCRFRHLNWLNIIPQWEQWCRLAGLDVSGFSESGLSPAKDKSVYLNRDLNDTSTTLLLGGWIQITCLNNHRPVYKKSLGVIWKSKDVEFQLESWSHGMSWCHNQSSIIIDNVMVTGWTELYNNR